MSQSTFASPFTDPELEDLKLLDVPTLPKDRLVFERQIFISLEDGSVHVHSDPRETKVIEGRPPNPVIRPLPGSFEESQALVEALGQFPLASTAPGQGFVTSKYLTGRLVDFSQHIRANKRHWEWEDLCDDPIFLDISLQSGFVSVEDLIARRNRERYGEEEDFAIKDGYTSHTAEYERHVLIESNNASNREETFGATGNTNGNAFESEEQRLAREQEERLAALGVSGEPKPVRAPARPYRDPGLPFDESMSYSSQDAEEADEW